MSWGAGGGRGGDSGSVCGKNCGKICDKMCGKIVVLGINGMVLDTTMTIVTTMTKRQKDK